MKIRRILVTGATLGLTLLPAAGASAHVHGITPLLTLARDCGVTSPANTGANRAPSEQITGLIPRDVGRSGLDVGGGGFNAPVGCVD